MICHQVTLSGDAEWPKVADAVIEAERRPLADGVWALHLVVLSGMNIVHNRP